MIIVFRQLYVSVFCVQPTPIHAILQPAYPRIVHFNQIDWNASEDGELALSVVALDCNVRETVSGNLIYVHTCTSQSFLFLGTSGAAQTALSLDMARFFNIRMLGVLQAMCKPCA